MNSQEAQTQYAARENRVNEAVNLRVPDRVPIACEVSFFATRYAGITDIDAMYDYVKMKDAWKQAVVNLNLDMMSPACSNMLPGPVMDMLGLKTFKWTRHGAQERFPFQYLEGEYLLADEYDELLKDPDGFTVRRLFPRMAKALEPLGMLPPLHWFSSGFSVLKLLPSFAAMPSISRMLAAFQKIGQEMLAWNALQEELSREVAQMGYPALYFAKTVVPFDWISDMLRGMKGSMLDMYRRPDKLKAAMDLFSPFLLESAVMAAAQSGNPRVVIPLHRGAGGFMSERQFEEFYWPGLRNMCESLIAEGLTPIPVFEGDYTSRLHFLKELPKGKIIGHFDVIDRKKAKEIIGDTICFSGGIPPSLFVTGSQEHMRDDVKELIDTFAGNGGLIIDGGAGIPDEARPENVEAMIDTVFTYGVL